MESKKESPAGHEAIQGKQSNLFCEYKDKNFSLPTAGELQECEICGIYTTEDNMNNNPFIGACWNCIPDKYESEVRYE
jgi:hypothetical protein